MHSYADRRSSMLRADTALSKIKQVFRLFGLKMKSCQKRGYPLQGSNKNTPKSCGSCKVTVCVCTRHIHVFCADREKALIEEKLKWISGLCACAVCVRQRGGVAALTQRRRLLLLLLRGAEGSFQSLC